MHSSRLFVIQRDGGHGQCRGGQWAEHTATTVASPGLAEAAASAPPRPEDRRIDWRGLLAEPAGQVDLVPFACRTLQEAAARADCAAFAVAAATLTVLFDAFPSSSVQSRFPISLESSVPTSAFQQRVLDLHDVLPSVGEWCRPSDLIDWLDSDIRCLCADAHVPAAKRLLFGQVPSWHSHAGHLAPRRVIVYTDGSATPAGATGDILPETLAISVWIEAGQDSHEYLLGCAADIMVQPEDLRYVGTVSDTPLECEQVALVWALAWCQRFARGSWRAPTIVTPTMRLAGRSRSIQGEKL